MYNRKYSYDSLRNSLRELSATIPKQNNVFSKAAEKNTFFVFQKYVELDKEKELAGAAIYQQWKDLKDDYEQGNINLKRYTEHLLAYKEFFSSDVQVQDLPKALGSGAEEILQEIQKYIG